LDEEHCGGVCSRRIALRASEDSAGCISGVVCADEEQWRGGGETNGYKSD
jgi:hypothetical protein